MESSTDPKKGRDNILAQAVAYGLIIGAIVGSVVFALTQNPVLLGIAPGLGLVVGIIVGTARQANRQ